jgi:hypothetical protein
VLIPSAAVEALRRRKVPSRVAENPVDKGMVEQFSGDERDKKLNNLLVDL